ncbi:Enzyme that catalyzes the fourth step in the histidine pathway [Scheffersomyces spartinae]|uniref:1-(5-phosphoribosyl)-5-[(5-phosphoribosylamino)methylideneamino] imidazole-4-carboxamide isomerase n=1 Tax=Scheffersomyces spartinae TaxID=45513 RepID=A0A9P8AJR2_9ASCO|nr:Enzyme that catalyzes the fourth step in the histidine pathway [Scheffersomyces spartinae]KAG7195090.1 Enzyme that catalyzes the fourth step in the histidine pathway [Scheffersomyces spartinae]
MTRFRGCIDLHSGKVKQIVGGTLTEDDINTKENFVLSLPSKHYAELYKENEVYGCHVIKLGPGNDEAAQEALQVWPNGLQVGGGINLDNALEWLDNYKASHIILTSWLFTENKFTNLQEFNWERLKKVAALVGRNRLIVDLSCRTVVTGDSSSQSQWVVAMNKWQTLTSASLSAEFLTEVSKYCDEFLIHAADVEGLCKGIDEALVKQLGEWCPAGFEGKIVYAGGAKLVADLDLVNELSHGKVDLTFGSSLDIFGGDLVKFEDVLKWNKSH